MQGMPISSVAPGGTEDARVDSVSVASAVDLVPGVHEEAMIASELSRPASMSSEM